MADEDKEKAEKVAAAKKRVGNPPDTLCALVNNDDKAIMRLNFLLAIALIVISNYLG
jgi:hypothetical protein